MICDFCSHPKPTVFYEAEDFEAIKGIAVSKGKWAACPECAALVEESKWDDLADRCLTSPYDNVTGISWQDMRDEYPGIKDMLVEMYQQLAFNINGHQQEIVMNINVYRIGTCPPGATRYGNRGVEVQAMSIHDALKVANARYKKHCDATGRCVFAVFSRREAKQ